jgi:hypothetical protein
MVSLRILICGVIATAIPTYAQDAVILNKGQSAPFTGILMTEDMAKDLKSKVIELDYEKVINASQTRQIDLYKAQLVTVESQATLWRDTSLKLSKELTDTKDHSMWKSVGGFVVGAVLTTAIAFAVNRSTR